MTINSLQRCKPLLGTFVEVSLQGNCSEQALLNYSELAFDELTRIHGLLSFHDKDSELSQVNIKLIAQPNEATKISTELSDILSLAQSLFTFSRGLYDLTIAPSLVFNEQLPNHLSLSEKAYGNFANLKFDNNIISTTKPLCLDLGGIAKGYAVDQAVKKLPPELEISINAGGDLYQNNWQENSVAVRYAKQYFAKRNIPMLNSALATSGNYYRNGKSAFIEPITKEQKKLHGCISVFAPSVMLADALTKIVLFMPKHECRTILELYNAQAFKISRFGFIKRF